MAAYTSAKTFAKLTAQFVNACYIDVGAAYPVGDATLFLFPLGVEINDKLLMNY